MSIRMHAIFLLCAVLLVPDVLAAPKSVEDFFEPDENEEVQAAEESLEEIKRDLGCEMSMNKADKCTGYAASIPHLPEIPCELRSVLVKVPGTGEMIKLARCGASYKLEYLKCNATGTQRITYQYNNHNNNQKLECYEAINHTRCEKVDTRRLFKRGEAPRDLFPKGWRV